jgi:two-component system, sensor histidine kinase
MTAHASLDGRVLALALAPQSATEVRHLKAAGIEAVEFERIDSLVEELSEGAALVLLSGLETTEAVEFRELESALGRQPAWSQIPVVITSRTPGTFDKSVGPRSLPGVTLLDGPSDKRVLLGAVNAGLLARRRQCQVRDQLEQLGRNNRELTVTVQAKDEFMATLAHELRNPLNALTAAERLLRTRDGVTVGGPAGGAFASGVIARQVSQMTRLLDDLLDVARITRNRLELRTERFSLAPLIRAAVETSQSAMDAKQHVLQVELPDVEFAIVADPSRISQVVTNLLTNAAKYTEHAGRIVLRVSHEGDDAVIAVRDNGIGIPPESLEAIFGMFTQLKSAMERSRSGLGIGLALVKGIVELHGGTIEVHSDGVGHGSEFIVRLPVNGPPSG